MAVEIINKLNAKCQNCPFFEVETATEEINWNNSKIPLFNVKVDCKHHDILCDGLEAMFHDETGTIRPGMKRSRCAYCDKVFHYNPKEVAEKGEVVCPRCGSRNFYID